jgi:hypothetical protein
MRQATHSLRLGPLSWGAWVFAVLVVAFPAAPFHVPITTVRPATLCAGSVHFAKGFP